MSKGQRIRELREKIDMNQVDMARAIGVSKQTLYKYENDIVTNIPSDKIEAIANLTHSTPEYIMGWDEKYYTNQAAARAAQAAFDDPNLRALFDAAKDSKPEDIQMAVDMLKRFKATNPDG